MLVRNNAPPNLCTSPAQVVSVELGLPGNTAQIVSPVHHNPNHTLGAAARGSPARTMAAPIATPPKTNNPTATANNHAPDPCRA